MNIKNCILYVISTNAVTIQALELNLLIKCMTQKSTQVLFHYNSTLFLNN